MKPARELKKFIEKIVKRGDLNITSFEIGDNVEREVLKQYSGKIPDDML